ncbi:MAG: MFS transporter [Sphingomonadales bacterium]
MATAAPTFKTEFVSDGGWKIVLASGLGVGLGLSALPFYTIGVFATSLEAEFGWTRAQVMFSTFFMMLANLCAGWAVGLVVDRIGVRRVAIVGQIGLAIGMCLLGLVSGALWMQYAAWFVMAFISLGTLPITWTRGIATWFDKGRGFAMGLALMGTGLAGYVSTKATPYLIESLGWRQAYFAWGLIVPLIAMPLVVAWFREKPSATGEPPKKEDLPGLPVPEILKNYRFWLMLLAFACVSFGVGGLLPNMVPLLESKGLTKIDAAGYASLIGIAVIGGRVFAGWLIDRFWAPAVSMFFLTVPAAACFFLTGDAATGTQIGVSAILIGLSAGAEFDLIAYMCTRYFGLKNYGFVYALQYMSFGLFSGLAPAIFGSVFDKNGTYDPVLGITAVLFIIGPLLLLGLGRYPVFAEPNPS